VSIRLQLMVFMMRFVVKPVLRRSNSVFWARRAFATSMRIFGNRAAFAAVSRRPVSGAGRLFWIAAPNIEKRRVILYFHGGGYIVGSPKTHSGLLSHLSDRTGLGVYAPAYRRAPEHGFPAQFDDAVQAWCALRARGYEAQDIVLGGDSAGGGLALALLAWVLSQGEQPGCVLAFSPWTDLQGHSPSLTECRASDPILISERLSDLVPMIAGSQDLGDPRLSPLYATFRGAPPVLLQFSDTEILRDDSVRMAEKLKADGAYVVCDRHSDLPHVWTLFAGRMPEADAALERVAQFISTHSVRTSDDS
jgi:acetyl esterase/lipase